VDLKYKNRELAASVLQMMKKNELLMHIVPRLKKVALSSPKSLNGELNSVIKDIEFDSKEIGWNEFELRFKEVHSEYYEKLTEEFPNLTKNEQRLCAFLKLKMTTKEISSITFQSEHSINVARSRMKKKMGITDNKRLLQYLSQL
jgi:DNA-binding CsgD family transcriptional regulator